MDIEAQDSGPATTQVKQRDSMSSGALPSLTYLRNGVQSCLRFVWHCSTFMLMTFINPSIWKEIRPEWKSTKRFLTAQKRGEDTLVLLQNSREIGDLPTETPGDRQAKAQLMNHATRFREAIQSQQSEDPWFDRLRSSKWAIATLLIGVILPAIDIYNSIKLMQLEPIPGETPQLIPGRITIIRNVPYDKYLITKIGSILLILYDGVMITRFAFYTVEICSSPLIIPDIAYLVVLNRYPELYDTIEVTGIIGALSVGWNLFLAYRLIVIPRLNQRKIRRGLYSQRFLSGCKNILENMADHAKIHIRRQEEAQNGGKALRTKTKEFFEPCCIARPYADLNAYKAQHIERTIICLKILLEPFTEENQDAHDPHEQPLSPKPSKKKYPAFMNLILSFSKTKGQQKVILVAAIMAIAFAIIPYAYRRVWFPLTSVFGWGVRGFAVLIALYLISTAEEMTSRFNNIMSTALGDIPLNILIIVDERIFGNKKVFGGIYALTFDLNLIHNDVFSTLIFNVVRWITKVERAEMHPLQLTGSGKSWTQQNVDQRIGLWEFE